MFESFNPRPRRGAGATLRWRDRYHDRMKFQSSPAPRRGRYDKVRQDSFMLTRFNPRPRRGAGATSIAGKRKGLQNVSILARAEARALPHHIAGLKSLS